MATKRCGGVPESRSIPRERPAMGSLAQKVDTLREQLGLVDGRPLAASVDEAVFQLGLADQVKGFNLVQQADACLTALGTPSASAAAAPVAPSATASRARAAEAITLEQFLAARLYLSIDEALPEGISPRPPREGEAPPSRSRDWYRAARASP